MDFNLQDWLLEFDLPPTTSPPDPSGGQSPMTDPNAQGQPPQPDPNVAGQQPGLPQDPQPQHPDLTNDPHTPDMPEEEPRQDDFETWKGKFIKESAKGDPQAMLDLLLQVRDRDGLNPYQHKFVEDNWGIILLRQHDNINKASKEIRRNLREQIDRNNPATSIVNHMAAVLETIPILNSRFIMMEGYGGLKGELHRKFIAALTGSVQVSVGESLPDLIYEEKDYAINISTRYTGVWGNIKLTNWSLREDDAEQFLSPPELKRLQEGSPQEKDALRKRVVIESVCKLYKERAFVITVMGDDGSIHHVGWDVATSLRAGFTEGKIGVRFRHSENSEALISDSGDITPLVDVVITYARETGHQDEDGQPERDEKPLIERKAGGILMMVADFRLAKEAATGLQGMSLKEVPYTGNPSDLKTLQRCNYSVADLILRQC